MGEQTTLAVLLFALTLWLSVGVPALVAGGA